MPVTKTPIEAIINQPGGVVGVGSNGRPSLGSRDFVSVKDFGAVGDGVTDDLTAFQNAILAVSQSGKIYIPQGTYFLSSTLVVTRRIAFVGTHSGQQAVNAGSRLLFPANVTGVRFHSSIEQPNGTSARSSMTDVCIHCSSKQTTGHGIHASAPIFLERVNVDNFAQNGIHIVASSSSSTGDASLWSVRDSRIANCGGHGFFADGRDANAGVAENMDSSSNGGWGIYDSSLHGNTYLACHISNNGIGAIKTSGGVNASLFVGTYIEGYGNYGCEVESPSMVFGGTAGAFNNYPFVTISGDGSGAKAYSVTNGGAVSSIQLEQPGSGYTSATVSIFGGSGAGATATATIENGEIVGFVVTNGGSGYPANLNRRVIFKEEGAEGGFKTGRIKSSSAQGSEWPSSVIINDSFDCSVRLSAASTSNVDVRYNRPHGSWDWCSNKSLATSSMRFVTNRSTTQTGGRSAVLPPASVMFPFGFWIGGGANGRQQTNGTAAPTTGEWSRGDIVWNRSPSPGGFVGWVCTTGGTPGTWKGYGAIEP